MSEAPLQVDTLREELGQTRTMPDALAVLSVASGPTVRELEAEYTFAPAPSLAEARARLARTHLNAVRRLKGQMLDTSKVTPAVFTEWVAGCLADWMVGYTDFDEGDGGQYRVDYLGGGEDGNVLDFEVSTVHRLDPRRLRVTVTVEDIPA